MGQRGADSQVLRDQSFPANLEADRIPAVGVRQEVGPRIHVHAVTAKQRQRPTDFEVAARIGVVTHVNSSLIDRIRHELDAGQQVTAEQLGVVSGNHVDVQASVKVLAK